MEQALQAQQAQQGRQRLRCYQKASIMSLGNTVDHDVQGSLWASQRRTAFGAAARRLQAGKASNDALQSYPFASKQQHCCGSSRRNRRHC